MSLDLNCLLYCRKHENEDNVSKILSLNISRDSNSISFVNINILLNNEMNCKIITELSNDELGKLISRIPSQFKTLLSLDNFIGNLKKFDKKDILSLFKSYDFKALSNNANNFSTTTALNNDELKQLVMVF